MLIKCCIASLLTVSLNFDVELTFCSDWTSLLERFLPRQIAITRGKREWELDILSRYHSMVGTKSRNSFFVMSWLMIFSCLKIFWHSGFSEHWCQSADNLLIFLRDTVISKTYDYENVSSWVVYKFFCILVGNLLFFHLLFCFTIIIWHLLCFLDNAFHFFCLRVSTKSVLVMRRSIFIHFISE